MTTRTHRVTTLERMASPKPSRVAEAHPATPAPFLGPAFDRLGVTLGAEGGTLRVWSEDATGIDLVVFDADDLDWITATIPLAPAEAMSGR